MASIKITPNEFADILSLFMIDYIMSGKMDIDNDRWEGFVSELKDRGLKAELVKYYISLSAKEKNDYKFIKKVFYGDMRKATINIVPDINNDTAIKESKRKEIKDIVKKVLYKIRSHKERYYGLPLHENVVSDIIDKVLNEEGIE